MFSSLFSFTPWAAALAASTGFSGVPVVASEMVAAMPEPLPTVWYGSTAAWSNFQGQNFVNYIRMAVPSELYMDATDRELVQMGASVCLVAEQPAQDAYAELSESMATIQSLSAEHRNAVLSLGYASFEYLCPAYKPLYNRVVSDSGINQ